MKNKLLFTFLCASFLLFNPSVSFSSECDDMGHRIINRVGGKIVRRTVGALTISHVLSEKISVKCDTLPKLFISNNTSHPSKKYLYLIGQAGNVVIGEEPERIVEAASQCNREALSSFNELAQVNLGRVQMNCRAFTSNTGGNAFTVALKRP